MGFYKRKTSAEKRRERVRGKILSVANGRPRLSIHRTSKHIYAQVIDDKAGVTLAAAGTVEKDLKDKVGNTCNVEAAAEVGRVVAERAVAAGAKAVVFDRGGLRYHGRVKALADAAREGGLEF